MNGAGYIFRHNNLLSITSMKRLVKVRQPESSHNKWVMLPVSIIGRFVMEKRTLDSRNGQRFAGMQASITAGLALLLTACGSGLSGQYSDNSGIMQYDFKSDGKVYVTTLGIQSAGEYEIDDDKLIIRGNNGNMVLQIKEDDTLIGPMGLVLSKTEDR
jgi:hypothetical protein